MAQSYSICQQLRIVQTSLRFHLLFYWSSYHESDYWALKHVGPSLKDIRKLQGLYVRAKVTPAIHRLSHLDVKRLFHTQRMCVHERHTAACVNEGPETDWKQTWKIRDAVMLPTQGIKEWTPRSAPPLSPMPKSTLPPPSITSILTLMFGPPILRRQHRQKEYIERSWELSEGLLSKALKDIRSGRLQEQRAALLYGIPLHTLRQGLDSLAEGKLGMLHQLAPGSGDFKEEVTSYNLMSSMLGGEARLVLQKVAAWAERAEIGGAAEENGDIRFPSSSLTFYQPSVLQKTRSHSFPQLRDALQPPPSPTPSLEPPTQLRIPQVRSMSDHNRSNPAENCSVAETLHHHTSSTEATTSADSSNAAARPSALFKLRPPLLPQASVGGANNSPHRLGPRGSSLDDSEEGADRRDKDKQPRKKRGRYRQYDHELLEEAIVMVMAGRMSVSKAQGVYGVPHSTLEYKVKERTGTLKNPPKKKSTNFSSSNSTSSGSGTVTGSTNSGNLNSAAAAKGF